MPNHKVNNSRKRKPNEMRSPRIHLRMQKIHPRPNQSPKSENVAVETNSEQYCDAPVSDVPMNICEALWEHNATEITSTFVCIRTNDFYCYHRFERETPKLVTQNLAEEGIRG
ncbi:hypothetical protein SARC_08611 [Sphaeroforma arctica JP610]|uniref:Uncharacterized protein n=1 Tax=Sphaeroforma arctica JP610 TaxID=667725 RepID=A0A0L0FR09_9EUKA|nr:hypothetical protein SARC_08611 [Sphaeroforma arctica JP610]KNC78981.1 hypothetical protein SARC_08611 [Sphaeroforma arctica JP610]|eukprot:XP_014152883.1 hypothetical protein SARC_08611 [Sphaeroforma arctica JP610]